MDAAVDCGNLTDILNGSVNFTETTFGSISTYSCNDGFGIQGSNERVCEATGQWNGSEPLCESKPIKSRGRERERERERISCSLMIVHLLYYRSML